MTEQRYYLPGIDVHVELTRDDYWMLRGLVGDGRSGGMRYPDEYISPLGKDYLFRWHLVKLDEVRVYVHVQVASDLDRHLHDHVADNQTVCLSGGYDEILDASCLTRSYDEAIKVNEQGDFVRHIRKGSVVARKAEEAHRLILPPEIPYTITLFTTGPKIREWGFYTDEGWVHADKAIAERNY